MYKAFPCSDYYGSSVTLSDIQSLAPIAFWLSDLGNLRLVHVLTISTTDYRMRLTSFYPLIAVALQSVQCPPSHVS